MAFIDVTSCLVRVCYVYETSTKLAGVTPPVGDEENSFYTIFKRALGYYKI